MKGSSCTLKITQVWGQMMFLALWFLSKDRYVLRRRLFSKVRQAHQSKTEVGCSEAGNTQ